MQEHLEDSNHVRICPDNLRRNVRDQCWANKQFQNNSGTQA
jgi:hypothetical protein